MRTHSQNSFNGHMFLNSWIFKLLGY